jgi:hypothetical protein
MQKRLLHEGNLEVSVRGSIHLDAIESVTFRHEEPNEGEKNRVERGNQAFCGCKSLKRWDH